jgi:ribosomal-protein-alanine N-acetyltransferase
MQFTSLPETTHDLVALRTLTHEDIRHWFDYLRLPAVYEHTSWNVQSPDDLVPFLESHEAVTSTSQIRFAIALRCTNEFVGTAGLHTVSTVNRTAEIAYDIEPKYWGNGIATSVCSSLVDWAFQHVGLVRVQGTVLPSNARSIRVLEKCGFGHEGLLRSHRLVRGTPEDFEVYARKSTTGKGFVPPEEPHGMTR